MLLSTMLLSFYGNVADSGKVVEVTQGNITQVALAISYMEIIQGLAFDEVTVDSFLTASQVNQLSSTLGPDNPPPMGEPREDQIANFDDIDDFNNFEVEETNPGGTLGTFRSRFNVYYVNPDNINQVSGSKTFVKRVDMTLWRTFPRTGDTLRTSFVIGYFHFD